MPATLGAGQQVPVDGAQGRGRRPLVTVKGADVVAGQGGCHRAAARALAELMRHLNALGQRIAGELPGRDRYRTPADWPR